MIPTLTDKPCVMGEAVQFSQLAASCITLCSGKAIVVIKPDGTIDYQGSTPDEAAQAFWDSVGRLHPAKKNRSRTRRAGTPDGAENLYMPTSSKHSAGRHNRRAMHGAERMRV
jgi:(2Fe-2S) ferredoxin